MPAPLRAAAHGTITSAGNACSGSICGASSKGVHAFAQAMIDQQTPGAIVNTGSKQGITCPPGDTAYNITKAGVKVLTESLAHALRNIEGCQVSAHLLAPGSTFTGMTARGRTEKPPGSWMPEQVVDFMMAAMAA